MRNLIKKILKEEVDDFDWFSTHIDHLEWIKIFLEEELSGYDVDIELIDDTTSAYDSDLWDFEDISGRGIVVGLPNRYEAVNYDVVSYLIQFSPDNNIVVSQGSVYYTDEDERKMTYDIMGEYQLKGDDATSLKAISKNIVKMYIGSDMNLNESDDFDWIRDVSAEVPSRQNRAEISYEEFFGSIIKDDGRVLDTLLELDMLLETDEEGDVVVNGQAYYWDSPGPYNYELREELEYQFETSEWKFIDRETVDYDLEYGSYKDAMIFQRKSDGRYFAYITEDDIHGDRNEVSDGLHEMFRINVPKWV